MARNELQRAAQNKLQMDVKRYYHFVFCGASGVGKSTLINALRNLEDIHLVNGKPHNMLGSAPVGEWQTTMDTLCYGYPADHDLKHVRLWDVPGLGTHEHPSSNYFDDKCLYAFVVIVVVIKGELGEYEYAILKNAEKQQIPIVIVLNKAEEKVESKIRIKFNTRHPPLADYAQIVQETFDEARKRISACLDKKGLKKVPIFIVSAWEYRDFMMHQENLEKISVQETNSNQNADPNIVQNEYFDKKALLASEMNELLDYIGAAAIHRRL